MSKEELAAKLKQIKILEDNINEYKDAFDIFDKDKTGIISTKDIIKIKKIFSYPISEKKIENMISEIDTKGEGKFDFKKFLILMKKQIQYIEEKEKSKDLESPKEDYLGNKRKRDYLIDDESIKQEGKIQIINNDTNINNEKGDILDSIGNEISSNADMNSKLSSKIDEEKIEIRQESNIENLYTKITTKPTTKKIIDNRYENIIICNNSKSKKSKKSNNIKSKANSIKSSSSNNSILIDKNILSKEMIEKIEPKKSYNCSILKIENNINYYIPEKENSLPSQKQIISFSSKCMSEMDLNNLSNWNSRENSFLSERSIDIFNRPALFPYCINSRLDRAPLINVVKRKKDKITNSSEKLLKGIRDKLVQKGIKMNKNKIENKENTTFILKEKLKKIVNDNFYSSEENTIKEDNIILDEEKKFDNISKSKDENITINLSDDEIKNNSEDNNNNSKNIENIPVIQDNILKEKIKILNSFELEYKKNENNEKIIQKIIEIPYLIIIEKKALNFEEIKNIFHKTNNSSTAKLKNNTYIKKIKKSFGSKTITESKASKAKSNYYLNKRIQTNFCNISQNGLKNNKEYKLKTQNKNENEKFFKFETQKKKKLNNNYENFEKSIELSKLLYSDGNHFKINTKFFEILSNKSSVKEEKNKKERKISKYIKFNKNEFNESLNSSDLLGELSYLYQKENQ